MGRFSPPLPGSVSQTVEFTLGCMAQPPKTSTLYPPTFLHPQHPSHGHPWSPSGSGRTQPQPWMQNLSAADTTQYFPQQHSIGPTAVAAGEMPRTTKALT